MYFARAAILALAAALAQACTQCTHPGNFVGALSVWWDPTDSDLCLGEVPVNAANIPASFWDPPDEAPCGMAINVTNPNTGVSIIATVASHNVSVVGDNLQLTSDALAALAPDADPNHAPATVDWTFVD